MFIINITQPLTLLLIVVFTVLMIFLGKETKKSFIPAISLVVFLILLVVYIIQFVTMPQELVETYNRTLLICLVVDFLLILTSFLGYLWIDDIDAKEHNKKSINNDLEWLWKKV